MSSPLVDQFRKGGVTRDVRMTAAEGMLPLTPADQIELLHLLTKDRDEDVRKTAERSLLSTKPESLRKVLQDTSTSAQVLGFFGKRISDAELVTLVLQNRSTEDATIESMVSKLTADLLEIVVVNQTRLLRHPPILVALEGNSSLTSDQRRRINELKHDFKIGEVEETVAPEEETVSEELLDLDAGPPEDEVPPPKTLEDAIKAYGDGADGELSDDEQQAKLTTFQRLVRMTPAEKMMEGLKGDREARMMLIRDRNRVVYSSVLNSPKITESEVETISSMRNVSPEVLRRVAGERKWVKRYTVAHELVRNPLTPIEVSMRLLHRIAGRDLKRLTRDRNVPEAIRRQAMKLTRSQQ